MMPSPRRQPTEECDLSSIQPPVKLGISGAEQVARCLAGGSDEIKHLLQQECHLIFECCICTGLFRSLANFLAHKRVYCKEDHMLPSSDLASHVSILRQYIQTKAAAMATLAEGANNQSSPTGSNLGTSPEGCMEPTAVSPQHVNNGPKIDQKEVDIGEISKKKKIKLLTSQRTSQIQTKGQRLEQSQVKGHHNETPGVETNKDSREKVNGKEKSKSAEKLKSSEKLSKSVEKSLKCIEKVKRVEMPSTSGLKKKHHCDALPNNIKRPQMKRKLLSGGGDGKGSTVNGSVNLAETFLNHTVAGGDNEHVKKVKGMKGKGKGITALKSMECRVVMKEKDIVVQPAVLSISPEKSASVEVSPLGTRKNLKKDMVPHLLYPCLYCDNVFPGTRMAIDHISTVHKKRKTINVSKIRTKIRKKAFVVKSGKKTRRFQKSSKSLEAAKEAALVGCTMALSCRNSEDDVKFRKRSQLSYQCSQCGKVYLYKMAMARHQLTCIANQKLAESSTRSTVDPSNKYPLLPALSPEQTKVSKGSSTATTNNHKMVPEKKNVTKQSTSPTVSTPLKNCCVLGSIVLSSGNVIKSEPDSPFSSLLMETGLDVVSTSSTGIKVESPFVIPVKSEYPCPYCMAKARKTFDLLFQHISAKHRDLRPSRKRVARFLMNSGYRCTWCKDPPRFFKNRVILRRHRVKEHGMKYTPIATSFAAEVSPKS